MTPFTCLMSTGSQEGVSVLLRGHWLLARDRGTQWWGGNQQECKATLPTPMMPLQGTTGSLSADHAPSPTCEGPGVGAGICRALATNITANKIPSLTEGILQGKCTSVGELAACQEILLAWQVARSPCPDGEMGLGGACNPETQCVGLVGESTTSS